MDKRQCLTRPVEPFGMFVTDQGLNRTVPLGFVIRYFSDANVGGTTAVFFSHCSKCSTAQEFGSEDASLMRVPGKYISKTGILRRHWKFPERYFLGLKLNCFEAKQQAVVVFLIQDGHFFP